MGNAYRQPGTTCTNCTGAPLRAFGQRLVCDECNRILIPDTDLQRTCELEASSPVTLAFRDNEPAQLACPRCRGEMRSVSVHIDGRALDARVHRCDAHGIWCGIDVLVGITAHASSGRPRTRTSDRGAPWLSFGGRLAPLPEPTSAARQIRESRANRGEPTVTERPPGLRGWLRRLFR